jgi:diguanylate cyclase (GGDEF)-like protein
LQVGLSTKLLGYVMAGVLITSAAIGVVRVQNERDEVLRDIGTLLRLHVRKSDVPARLGDEFGIVLYHTNIEQAERFVEILMEGVRTYALDYDGFQLNIGLSIGIAQYDASMSAPQELHYAADKALYQAKHGGRGRYCVYSEASLPQEKASS